MRFEQTMLRAKVAIAEAAVADYRLQLALAGIGRGFLVLARGLPGHAAADGESEVQC